MSVSEPHVTAILLKAQPGCAECWCSRLLGVPGWRVRDFQDDDLDEVMRV